MSPMLKFAIHLCTSLDLMACITISEIICIPQLIYWHTPLGFISFGSVVMAIVQHN